MLGAGKTLMVVQSADESRPPWSGPGVAIPGEEDAVRVAEALTRWWGSGAGASAVRAVVGTSAATSPARWAAAPKLNGASSVVIVDSDEPPGVLGKRLRRLATDPANAGKFLAVASKGGRLRPDLAASLLEEGKLAAVGVYEVGPVGRRRADHELAEFNRAVAGGSANGRRIEEAPGPFTWRS
jgi:hypothetical protein